MTRGDWRVRFAALSLIFLWACAAPRTLSMKDRPEVMGWGNVTGMRVDGQLLELETGLCLVSSNWERVYRTWKEVNRQRHRFARVDCTVTVTGRLDSVYFTKRVKALAPGVAAIDVTFEARADTVFAGAWFSVELPGEIYGGGTVRVFADTSDTVTEFRLPVTVPMADDPVELRRLREYQRTTAKRVLFVADGRQLEVSLPAATSLVMRGETRRRGSERLYVIRAYFAVLEGDATVGQTATGSFTLRATGDIDREPVTINIDPSRPGQAFDGLGGNFRLQNARTDPQVIDYNLNNLRVAWGRVEMPWRYWHPDEDIDPLEAARSGQLDDRVHRAMHMAQRLAARGIPVIVSAWRPAAWARLGEPIHDRKPGDPFGTPLQPDKMEPIIESLGDYLVFLKEAYGVEAVMFSFNESDLGIDVRQTPEEHVDLIKRLGAHMAARGLATRMLLGDTSDARPIDFLQPALADPEALRYVGAVSYHSWRGWTDDMLRSWHEAARDVNVPLLIGEGSTDAAAWRYPQIFEEPSFALHEIILYLRILAVSQPRSILQWQLTADYSLLAGGGVFGNDKEPLRPMQRFWNLKQLASTPAGAFLLPSISSSQTVHTVAYGDIARGTYAVHMVNAGAARDLTLTGLPDAVTLLRPYRTDSERGMQAGKPIPVLGGSASLRLDAASFTTLISVSVTDQ